jgi:hypothetical protein
MCALLQRYPSTVNHFTLEAEFANSCTARALLPAYKAVRTSIYDVQDHSKSDTSASVITHTYRIATSLQCMPCCLSASIAASRHTPSISAPVSPCAWMQCVGHKYNKHAFILACEQCTTKQEWLLSVALLICAYIARAVYVQLQYVYRAYLVC